MIKELSVFIITKNEADRLPIWVEPAEQLFSVVQSCQENEEALVNEAGLFKILARLAEAK